MTYCNFRYDENSGGSKCRYCGYPFSGCKNPNPQENKDIKDFKKKILISKATIEYCNKAIELIVEELNKDNEKR